MKMDKSALSLNRHFSTILLVSVLAVSSIFMLSGCSTTKDTEAPPPVQETNNESAATIQPGDHVVAPANLLEAAKTYPSIATHMDSISLK